MKILLQNIDQLTEDDLLELQVTSRLILFRGYVINNIEKRIKLVNEVKEDINYHKALIQSYEDRLDKIMSREG